LTSQQAQAPLVTLGKRKLRKEDAELITSQVVMDLSKRKRAEFLRDVTNIAIDYVGSQK
jgi:hypothetical protein